MIVLFPGTVVVYVPYRLLAPFSMPALNSWSATQYAAVLLLAIGVSILLKSIWSFAHVGKGMLAAGFQGKRIVGLTNKTKYSIPNHVRKNCHLPNVSPRKHITSTNDSNQAF